MRRIGLAISVLLFTAFFASAVFAQDYRRDEEGNYYQILRWGWTNASAYDVEIEKRGIKIENESGEEEWQYLPETTLHTEPHASQGEDESVEVSLVSGRYRFRIIGYNALGRKAATSEWTYFHILPAVKPEADEISLDALEVVKGSDTFTLHLTGRNLIEGAEVTLIPKGKKDALPVRQISATFSDNDDWMDVVLPSAELAKGNYDIVIINPGEMSQTLTSVPVRLVNAPKVQTSPNPKEKKVRKYDTNLSLGWSYLPTIPALNKLAKDRYYFKNTSTVSEETLDDIGFPNTYYPIGGYFRVNWLPFEFARSALGFDLSISVHYLHGKADTDLGKSTVTGLYMMADAQMLYKIYLMKRTAAVSLRAGVGFGGTPAGIHYDYENNTSNYYIEPDDWSYGFGSWDINLGASFEKTIIKNWFVELGMDYSQPIFPAYAIDGDMVFWFENSPYWGNFRLWLGTGWRFGPERDAEGNKTEEPTKSKRKHDVNLSLGWSYVPYLGTINEMAKDKTVYGYVNGSWQPITIEDAGYSRAYYPIGFYTRLSWLPFEFGIHAVGFEFNFSLHGIRSKKDTSYGTATLDGAYMVIDLGLLWKIWFQQRTLALAFRFGAGVEGLPPDGIVVHYDNGNSDIWTNMGYGAVNITAGVSVEKILWRGLFVEGGLDYNHSVEYFAGDSALPESAASIPGAVRVYLGLGWRFAPER